MSLLLDTPTERYEVAGREVWVKREDLLAPDPAAPSLAKMRGLERRLIHASQVGFKEVGAFDTHVSVSAWAAAWISKRIDGPHVTAYYPQRQADADKEPPWRQQRAIANGATAHAIPAGRTGVCWGRARADQMLRGGYMLPMGLTCAESVHYTMLQTQNVPAEARGGDVIVSVGSGMMVTGVACGLAMESHRVYGISCGMSTERQRSRAKRVSGVTLPSNVSLLLPGAIDYYTPAEVPCPFSANRYYDLKAWGWLMDNIEELREPILFWNVGADYEEE